jgi:hypothetical protein
LPFFEDLLLEAFRGVAEQLDMATAGIFTGRPGRRDLKDFTTNFRKHLIDFSLMFDQVFVDLVFIHCKFTNHGVHLLFNLFHKIFNAMAVFQLNAKSGKWHILRCQFTL